MTEYRVGALVGSLSSESINRRLLDGLAKLGREEAGLVIEEIRQDELPMFNRDLVDEPPRAVTEFKEALRSRDALLIVSPEYNRSIPGSLKSSLDWMSRPMSENPVAGAPTAVIGASRGKIGTAAGQAHLRDVLAFLDVRLMSKPEAYVQYTDDLIGGDDTIAESAREFLGTWLGSFHEWIEFHRRPEAK